MAGSLKVDVVTDALEPVQARSRTLMRYDANNLKRSTERAMPMTRVSQGKPIDRPEFHRRLIDWFTTSDEDRIGDPDVDGRTAWVWVHYRELLVKLHADANRSGVREYLALVRREGEEVPWRVVESRRGKKSKVA